MDINVAVFISDRMQIYLGDIWDCIVRLLSCLFVFLIYRFTKFQHDLVDGRHDLNF